MLDVVYSQARRVSQALFQAVPSKVQLGERARVAAIWRARHIMPPLTRQRSVQRGAESRTPSSSSPTAVLRGWAN